MVTLLRHLNPVSHPCRITTTPRRAPGRALPGCHGPAWQPEALVVSSIDVPDQFVHLGAVPVGCHLQGLLKRGAACQEAAEPKEGSPSKAARKAKWKSKLRLLSSASQLAQVTLFLTSFFRENHLGKAAFSLKSVPLTSPPGIPHNLLHSPCCEMRPRFFYVALSTFFPASSWEFNLKIFKLKINVSPEG